MLISGTRTYRQSLVELLAALNAQALDCGSTPAAVDPLMTDGQLEAAVRGVLWNLPQRVLILIDEVSHRKWLTSRVRGFHGMQMGAKDAKGCSRGGSIKAAQPLHHVLNPYAAQVAVSEGAGLRGRKECFIETAEVSPAAPSPTCIAAALACRCKLGFC